MDTSIFSHLNWLAILVSGVAYFIIGGLWYSVIFKKSWIRLTGVNMNDPAQKQGVGASMVTSFILMIICSLGMALLLYKLGSTSWMTGLKVGLITGFFFSFISISITYVYEKRPFGLYLINGGYNLVGCVAIGIVLSMWR